MEEKSHRWLVKNSLFEAWRELPGEHTPTEIWRMRWQGKFWGAKHQTGHDTGLPQHTNHGEHNLEN